MMWGHTCSPLAARRSPCPAPRRRSTRARPLAMRRSIDALRTEPARVTCPGRHVRRASRVLAETPDRRRASYRPPQARRQPAQANAVFKKYLEGTSLALPQFTPSAMRDTKQYGESNTNLHPPAPARPKHIAVLRAPPCKAQASTSPSFTQIPQTRARRRVRWGMAGRCETPSERSSARVRAVGAQ